MEEIVQRICRDITVCLGTELQQCTDEMKVIENILLSTDKKLKSMTRACETIVGFAAEMKSKHEKQMDQLIQINEMDEELQELQELVDQLDGYTLKLANLGNQLYSK